MSAETDRAGIAALLNALTASFRERNVDAFLSHYATDAVIVLGDRWTDATDETLRAFYKEVFESFQSVERLDETIDEIIAFGEWALVRRTGVAEIVKPSGERRIFGSRHLTVVRKQADGTWKIARDIWRNPPSEKLARP